jgi:hypothetical protein
MKMYLRVIVWGGMDWIHLAEDKDQWEVLLKTVMNLPGSIKCWEIF